MSNKMDKVSFSNDCVASDLLDSHALDNDKICASTMARSSRPSLEGNSVDIGEITESPDTEYMSTSAILHYCKSKILVPYLKLLTIMGLRPVVDVSNSSKFAICLSHFHSAQVAVFMFLGYILQYMACFRRDRGFCYKLVPLALSSTLEYETYKQVCYGNVTLTYIGPSILHFTGFSYALYLFRISDNEQLQNLMERRRFVSFISPSAIHHRKNFLGMLTWRKQTIKMQLPYTSLKLITFIKYLVPFLCSVLYSFAKPSEVFLLSSYAPQGLPTSKPKRLLRMLWFFIILSVLWMCLSLCSVNMMMAKGSIMFRWMESSSNDVHMTLRILLIICTLIHDMVQATIITSYCLQAQLLQAHLMFLKERLLNRTMSPLHWMREISEFRKLLKYLNDDLAPAVCLFTVVNVSWAASGALWLLGLDRVDTDTEPLPGVSLLNQALWAFAVAAPFVQAARLSQECCNTQSVGHELCVRPFLHQDTSQEEIITILMYASNLKLQAELFYCPIAGRYVFFLITVSVITIFSLGMCHYLQ